MLGAFLPARGLGLRAPERTHQHVNDIDKIVGKISTIARLETEIVSDGVPFDLSEDAIATAAEEVRLATPQRRQSMASS